VKNVLYGLGWPVALAVFISFGFSVAEIHKQEKIAEDLKFKNEWLERSMDVATKVNQLKDQKLKEYEQGHDLGLDIQQLQALINSLQNRVLNLENKKESR
jgi:hypothetical protein